MEQIKQVLGREDQETNINIDYFGKEIVIYTSKASVMNRMLKKGYKPAEVSRYEGEICGMTFRFSNNMLSKFLRRDIFHFD